ncbi:MAG TPA: thioesterase family protein [Caulobacteraceae bacterium]|nr:thioesterase family protein [Caulobacteraceae bacterium]
MTTATLDLSMPLEPLEPGLWRTRAGQAWSNPGGGLWGGYAIGLCVRVLEAEPEAIGEALSLTLTYAAGLPYGDLDVRTRRLRQGGSIGVWQVEILPAGSDQVGVHGMVTLARRPPTPPFAFAAMPEAPDPESLPSPEFSEMRMHMAGRAFERRGHGPFPPEPGDSRTLHWTRSPHAPLDKALLGMITDNSAPRAMYALPGRVMTTTLSLTCYLHATAEELAEVGNDYILVECEGRVGGGGASDERSSYWRRDGKLLATSEQLAWYREIRPESPE